MDGRSVICIVSILSKKRYRETLMLGAHRFGVEEMAFRRAALRLHFESPIVNFSLFLS